MRRQPFVLALAIALALAPPALAQPSGAPPGAARPTIVAAENVYGDVAGQVAGDGFAVTSILSSPDQDPHLFEASPSTARALSSARVVIYNGLDYDPWMARLLRVARGPDRQVVVVADLVRRRAGANPHLWYDPAVMPVVAKALADALAAADPAHATDYAQRLQAFTQSLKPLDERIGAMRARLAGAPVTATEPVFGYMATALGLTMRNERFQLAVMNNTEPRASDVSAFEADLRGRRVRALLYNSQATGPTAQRMVRLAKQANIPVVGITETQPAGTSYQSWMLAQLDALDAALAAPR